MPGWPTTTTPAGRTSPWTWRRPPTGSPRSPTANGGVAAAAARRPGRRSEPRPSRPSPNGSSRCRRWPATPGAVEFDRVVPASGNLQVAGKQFWLGPARAGVTVTFWADHDVIHLLAGGARLKTVRSHLSTADLARLRRHRRPPRRATTAASPRGRRGGDRGRPGRQRHRQCRSRRPARSWPPRSSPAGGSRSASTPPP